MVGYKLIVKNSGGMITSIYREDTAKEIEVVIQGIANRTGYDASHFTVFQTKTIPVEIRTNHITVRLIE